MAERLCHFWREGEAAIHYAYEKKKTHCQLQCRGWVDCGQAGVALYSPADVSQLAGRVAHISGAQDLAVHARARYKTLCTGLKAFILIQVRHPN